MTGSEGSVRHTFSGPLWFRSSSLSSSTSCFLFPFHHSSIDCTSLSSADFCPLLVFSKHEGEPCVVVTATQGCACRSCPPLVEWLSSGPRGGKDSSPDPPKSHSSELKPHPVPWPPGAPWWLTAGQAEMEVSAHESEPLRKAGRAKNNTTNAIKGMMEEVEMTWLLFHPGTWSRNCLKLVNPEAAVKAFYLEIR